MVEPVAKDHDPALEQALLVLRGVVLEVLRQVAVGASGADRLDHLPAPRALELRELGGEPSVLLTCELLSHQTTARPRDLRLAAVCRRCADSSTLRRRTFWGVTSTHSSSRISSSACSSERTRAGISRTSSSAEAARMFVSFFSFVALTSRSSARAFSPTIIPS